MGSIERHILTKKKYLVFEINEYISKLNQKFLTQKYHGYNQLLVLSCKKGSALIDDKKYPLRGYSLITLMKNQTLLFDKFSTKNGFILLFDDKELNIENSDLYSSLKLSLFECALKPEPTRINENDFNVFIEIFELLNKNLSNDFTHLKNDMNENLLLMLLQKVLRLKTESRIDINVRNRVLLIEFNNKLSKSLMNSRSVKYYADSLAVTPKKLNSITKTYFNLTAKEFIEEKIINESKLLLINGSCTIKEISYTMGFTEPTNFNKFFKKHTSRTPQQFRNQYHNVAF